MQYFAFIGDSKLGYAELESRFDNIDIIKKNIISFSSVSEPNIRYMGSVKKIAKFINKSNSNNIYNQLTNIIVEFCAKNNLSKIHFAINQYPTEKFHSLEKTIKQNLTQSKIKSRYIRSKDLELSAASIIYNKLATTNCELNIIKNNKEFIICQTIAVQDINSYSKRDILRPRKDLKVGMLPPKLAQIMISLANPESNWSVFDPFCGSGVVLQESMLQNYSVLGSDISQKMINNTNKNLGWLIKNFNITSKYRLVVQDATKLKDVPNSNYCLVSEGFLGDLYINSPDEFALKNNIENVSQIYLNFLKNLTILNNKPKIIVISLPFWKLSTKIIRLNIIDQINKLGYTISQFKTVDSNDLIYIRKNQIVGRQLLVLKIK